MIDENHPRLAVRQARTAPLVEAFGAWLRKQRARVSPKSRLGEKLAYIGNHWDGLQVFLIDGRVEMDTNIVYSVNRINDIIPEPGLFRNGCLGSRLSLQCRVQNA